MAKAKILYGNLVDDVVTWTATTEEATYEKEYVYDKIPSARWRSTAIVVQSITMDFGAAQAIKGVGVFNTNMDANVTTYEWESSDNNFAATIDTESLTQAVDCHALTAWNRRYYRVRMVKSAGTYIQVGEIFVPASTYEFDADMSHEGLNDNYNVIDSQNVGEQSGQIFRTVHKKPREFGFTVRGHTNAQKTTFKAIADEDYVCLLPWGANSTVVIFGVLEMGQSQMYAMGDNTEANVRWTTNFTFRECPK